MKWLVCAFLLDLTLSIGEIGTFFILMIAGIVLPIALLAGIISISEKIKFKLFLKSCKSLYPDI